jgi:AAA domain
MRAKRVLREANLAERDDLIYLSVPDGLALDSDERERDELEQIVTESRPSVLALDPYYKARRGDANEERAVVDLMRYLDRLRAEYGFALILPAHPRKDATSNGARKLTLHDVSGSGAVTRGAELVLALERLSHGYGRLRILKDRDFDLQVGEAWPLLFERGQGFKRDPKDERDAADLEQQVIGDTSGEWRTRREWAGELGIREKRAGELLDKLLETGHVEFQVGPLGRSPKAHCYRTAPDAWAQSGAVTPSLPDDGTAPTTPTSIGDVGSGRSSGGAPTPGAVNDSKRPLLGDEMYPILLADAGKNGHLAENEFFELYELHKLVEPSQEERSS